MQLYSISLVDSSFRFLHRLLTVDLLIAVAAYLLVPIGAYVAFRQQRMREDLGRGIGAFLRYCLPLHYRSVPIWKHPSVRLDIGFTLVKKFVNAWLLIPLLLSSVLVSQAVYAGLTSEFGARAQHEPGFIITSAIIAVCILAQDFVQFLIHYMHHKVKLFWDVHKVHHSTEFMLMSFSVKRTHVLEEAVNLTLSSCCLGVIVGVLSYAWSLQIIRSQILGVDAWFFMHLFSFWHLRHSHISLSYGPLEHILQSPAQHQLHHSVEREHWDRNFGLLFSFWDKLFGCFLLSVDPRNFRLGLPEADRADYDTVVKLYLTPFRKIHQAVMGRKTARSPGLTALAVTTK